MSRGQMKSNLLFISLQVYNGSKYFDYNKTNLELGIYVIVPCTSGTMFSRICSMDPRL